MSLVLNCLFDVCQLPFQGIKDIPSELFLLLSQKLGNLENIMSEGFTSIHEHKRIQYWVPTGTPKRVTLSFWNKRMVKLASILEDQEPMFSIAETSETHKSSCFMGKLSKVLPKSLLKA